MKELWKEEGMLRDYITDFCKKCNYHKKGCWYDYGDSLTKIPCYALSETMRKEKEYAFEDLSADLKRLDKKIDGLEGLNLELEKIVAPVYMVAQINLIAKYLGVRIKEPQPLENDKMKER